MPRSRRRTVALLLSVLPGWGHIYLGRERLGLLGFTVAAIFGFGLLNGLFIYRGEGRSFLVWGAGVLLVVTLGVLWADVIRRVSPSRVERDRAARERFLGQGTIAYLHDDLDTAEVDFGTAVALDPQDVDARFRLGVVVARRAVRAGDAKLARTARQEFEATLRSDLDDKWIWEIERELRGLLPLEQGFDVVGEATAVVESGESGLASTADAARNGRARADQATERA